MNIEEISSNNNSFVFVTDEPARIEVTTWPDGSGGVQVIAYAYKGTEFDLEQEPTVFFDSTNPIGEKVGHFA